MKLKSGALTLSLIFVNLPSLAANIPPVTFYKDVLPVLQNNCQSCHRPGQMGPMSFLTYKDTRPWAKAIKYAVILRKMPPWFADPNHGHFTNDRSLNQKQIDILARWADSGASEGNEKDALPPIEWPDGWVIEPDLIVPGSTFDVPAKTKSNVIEWTVVTVPGAFNTDTWINSIQIKPKHPEVVHHICANFAPHTPDVRYHVPEWIDKERDEEGSALPSKGPTFGGRKRRNRQEPGYCYVPGNVVADYRSFGAAKLVRAGSDIILNLHYTPNGVAVRDEIQIGFTVLREQPKRRYLSLTSSAPTDPKVFAIPPLDPNWQSPPIDLIFKMDTEIVSMMPHMHARGKDITYTLEYPDGRKEVILHVPRYDFNWQLTYQTSVRVPKGSRLHVDAHFDNSRNNLSNPNPNRTVYYGEMTWEEMMMPFVDVLVNPDVQSEDQVFVKKDTPPNSG